MQRRTMVAVGLATLGLVLSLLLERLHVQAYLSPSAESFCALGERLDCTTVALSSWSVIGGVPLPLWGAVGFFAIGVAAVTESRWLLPLTAIAALASLGLFVIEIALVGAICLLCEAVHLVSFGLFGLALSLRKNFTRALYDRKHVATVFVPPAVAVLGMALFLPHYWGAFAWSGDVPFPQGRTPEGHAWIGAVEPKVTLHEFTDYRCPHCKSAASRTLRRVSEHPKSLRVVRHQFPRGRCPKRPNNGCIGIRMAYCAGEQDKFWQADRWLFEHGGSKRSEAPAFAEAIGLDLGKLQVCLAREDLALRAAAEAEYGLAQKFTGTPSYMVEGEHVPETALDALVSGLP
jgi:uncharacterized membrane protein